MENHPPASITSPTQQKKTTLSINWLAQVVPSTSRVNWLNIPY